MKSGHSEFVGKVIKRQPVNKVGRPMLGLTSYFLEIGEDRYFIKAFPANLSIENYVDQVIRIKGKQAYGQWDSDDPMVQSRVGDYIIIEELVE